MSDDYGKSNASVNLVRNVGYVIIVLCTIIAVLISNKVDRLEKRLNAIMEGCP